MRRTPWILALIALFILADVGAAEMSAFVWHPKDGLRELGSSMCARAVNNRGQVCGELWTGPTASIRAFVWSPSAGTLELETAAGFDGSNCFALGEDGTAVGASFTDDPTAAFRVTAVMWTREGVVDLGSSGTNSAALGVNEHGFVVGWSMTGSGTREATLWIPRGGMMRLGTLGGANSVATDVNNRGQVAGYSDTDTGEIHAFVWTLATGMTDLGTLGGTDSKAFAISESGLVTGSSETAAGLTRAFAWSRAAGLVDLGSGNEESAGFGINNRGQVAGGTLEVGIFSANRWSRAGGESLAVPSGVIESLAWDVNDRGEIVGYLER